MTNDMPDLSGKTALVTGASRGIGRATALALAKAGAHVLALARTTGGLEELDDEIRSVGGKASLIPMDLTEGNGIERLAEALRRLPIVEHVFPSDANFLLVRATDVRLLLERCAASRVVVRDRSGVSGLEACVRISVGEAEALEVLLAALAGEVPAR